MRNELRIGNKEVGVKHIGYELSIKNENGLELVGISGKKRRLVSDAQ